MVIITIIHHLSDSKFRVYKNLGGMPGPGDRDDNTFATLDEAEAHAKQLDPDAEVVVIKKTQAVIRIAITQAAFDAIARTMPFGSVNFEAGVDDKRALYLLPRAVVDRLRSLRGPAESFSDVILQLGPTEI